MLLNHLTYHSPTTAQDAAKLIADLDSVKLQAGGTFLLNSLKLLKHKGAKTPEHIVGLNKVEELKGIEVSGNQLIIRSMATIDDLFTSSALPEELSILKTACKNISTQPIRNMATVGGNLTCRYTWTEMPAVMIALDAQMHFIDAAGKEEVMPAEDFFANQAKTDKLFTHVTIDINKDVQYSYQRIRKSASVDIPLLSLLINATIKNGTFENIRIGVNNCVHFAQRDLKLEEFLKDKKVDEKTATEALNNLTEDIYDSRSSEYKKTMFRTCIKNALLELAEK